MLMAYSKGPSQTDSHILAFPLVPLLVQLHFLLWAPFWLGFPLSSGSLRTTSRKKASFREERPCSHTGQKVRKELMDTAPTSSYPTVFWKIRSESV